MSTARRPRLTCSCAAQVHHGEAHCWNCGEPQPLPGQARTEKAVREHLLRSVKAVEFGGIQYP